MRDGAVTEIARHGILLGALRNADWTETTCVLAPGETLVTFTDGVTDALGRDGERFGVERLKDQLAQVGEHSAELAYRAVADSLAAFQHGEQADDIAIVPYCSSANRCPVPRSRRMRQCSPRQVLDDGQTDRVQGREKSYLQRELQAVDHRRTGPRDYAQARRRGNKTLLNGATTIEIDLANLGFIDSTGLRMFLQLNERAASDGWSLLMVKPSEPIRMLLRITGSGDELPIEEESQPL